MVETKEDTRARRRWTPGEDATLRRDYESRGGPAVARELGRPIGSVYHRVETLGLAHRGRVVADDAFRASLRRLHAGGFSDPEVAARLGCDRHTAARHRRALGLPSNRLHARQRARVAERTREQCRAAGVRSLAGVRAAAFRAHAAASGWGDGLAPREVHILEALAARGPMTRPEIAAAVGLPWIGSRRSLKSSTAGGSYLATLARRGLVVRLGRVVRGAAPGESLNLYSLSLDAERRTDHA